MAFLDVWNNKENNVDNVMADDVNLLAEYISRNENNIEKIKQNIKNISYAEVDSFTSGYAVVTSSETTDSEGGPILTEYHWPVVAECSSVFGSISVTQTRFYNGKLERRVGTGSESSVAWGQWKEYLVDSKFVPSFDLVIDSDTDLSQYADQTISGKKIFFKKGQVSSSVINITFSSCVIYGNNKSFGTHGTVSYKYCIIYDLNSSPHYDDGTDPVSGQSIFEDCKIYGGSMSEYYEPSVARCRVHGCSFSALVMSVGTKDSIYDQCDFGNCYPLAMTGNTYNIFTNCYNMSGDYAPLTGECYFSGCRGSVMVSSSATVKPSTTTAFADHNFATLIIS